MPKPWLIYARVSTDEQGSLPAQIEACASWIRVLGAGVGFVEEIDDGFSGKDLDRPAMQRVLAAVESATIAGVVIWKLDRLTRSIRDLVDLLERFDRAGVSLASVQERLDTTSAMGRMVTHILGVFAQFERETIAERVKMGMRHANKQGFYTGRRVPPGCRVVGPARQKVLERDPERGDAVATMWSRVAAGLSLKQVAEHLVALGYPRMTASGIRSWLLNERMIGLLVNRADFERAIAALGSRFSPQRHAGTQHPASHPTDREWPLRGILRCHLCGAPMAGVTVRNGVGVAYPYLRCGTRNRKGRTACALKDMPAQPTESAVIAALVQAIVKEDQIPARLALIEAKNAADVGPARERMRDLSMEMAKTEQRIASLVDAIADGGALARALRPKLADLQAQLERQEVDRAGLEGAIAHAEADAGASVKITALFATAVAGLEQAPIEDQVEVIRSLVRSVRIDPPDGIDFELNLPRAAQAQEAPRESPGGLFVGREPSTTISHWLTNNGPTLRVQTTLRRLSLREWNQSRQ